MKILKKSTPLIIFILISSYLIFAWIPWNSVFRARFDSPEKALESDRTVDIKHICDVIQNNNTALLIYETQQGAFTNKIAICDTDGWKSTERRIEKALFHTTVDTYTIVFGQIESHFYLYISTFQDEAQDTSSPYDNLQSVYLKSTTATSDSSIVYWFTSFETNPEGLVLTINNNDIKIT